MKNSSKNSQTVWGIDIGIASVGWAVVNENYEVLESGANLFDSADASKNFERRGFRQHKRLLRRKKNRIFDFKKMWKSYGLEIPEEQCNSQIKLRNKGIKEQLKINEIYYVLCNMLVHRGISYLEDAFDESKLGQSEYQKGLSQNREELKNKFPCEIQLERLEKYGKYRGHITVKNEEGEKITLSNVFTKNAYRREIEKIFDVQKEFYDFITEDFIQKYTMIFDRKREYYEGPGNELSRTDYGKYTTKIDLETGEYITEDNIFEKLIGKCSVYQEETRAAGASYTAQEFNILNDLNNLTINERKLTEEEKGKIIQKVKESNSINMRKVIKNVIREEIETFTGARIDKSEKEIFHSFEQYNKMRKELNKIGEDINQFGIEELDKIGEILTINTEKEAIIKAFERDGLNLDEQIIECFIQLRKKSSALFNKWQSFSIRIMRELIPEMYAQPKNQMELLTDMGVFKTDTDKFRAYNKIPKELVVEEIYNPVVCRSIRVTIDVINALIKKYGYPKKIVIEMPRDKNSEEEQKRIKDTQKKNEKELEDIIKKIKSEYGIIVSAEQLRTYKKLPLKLKLWNEQNGICLYSGKPIDIFELIANESKFEVDHIIPRSISFDDSRNNKVLVYVGENQQKGNLTPYMYLSNLNREWAFERFKGYVIELRAKNKISRKKVDNLLFVKDITKIEVLKGFVSRNINDTRYASRVILNTFQSYFKSKKANTKVSVIRGSFTNQMRKNMKLKKDREESFAHHAVDAMLICYSQMGYEAFRKMQNDFIDFETGEILDESLWDKYMNDEAYADIMYQNKWLQIKQHINEAEKKVKYWHKVDKKANRGLCNQTIRGTREIDGKNYKINKLNIYEPDGYKTFVKMIESGKQEQFLMWKNDKKTFENLLLIFKEYRDAKNAFVEYEKETGDFPRKYSKKHNGPKVSILKYTNGEVGSCIDISHKYGFEKNSQKVILESLKPYRTDVYFNINTKEYYLVGLKYSDIKVVNDKMQIDEEAYNKVLQKEKMLEEEETLNNLEEKGYLFKFSLYKNDFIQYEKNGEFYMEIFRASGTKPDRRNYIETRPINALKFKGKDRNKGVGLSKTKLVRKIRVDILGNRYYCDDEKFEFCVEI